MNSPHKIALIGATGKSGKYLLKELLHQGFHCKLLLRSPEHFLEKNPLIETVNGDARNYTDVKKLVNTCTAVISTLGQPKGEPSIFSNATQNILHAMKEESVSRYIVTTGLNVDTPVDKKGVKSKMATEWMYANYPETTKDKQLEYELLRKSNVNWTLIRLPLIEQTDKRRNLLVSLEDCPGDKISSSDLAVFLIEQLYHNDYVEKAPFIAS